MFTKLINNNDEEAAVATEATSQSQNNSAIGEDFPDFPGQRFSNDGTCVTEFSIVDNTLYSEEIINTARALYNLEALEDLKSNEDFAAFYAEGKKQILSQWHADQALAVHTDLFRISLQVNVGEILNKIEPTFQKKSDYTAWMKSNFELKHMRYFQQARQLADMGDFAREYAAVGKNRLLALDHLRKVEGKRECEALFEIYPLPDISEDEDGQLLKRHVDAVITLHRLKNAGIRFVTFDQATLIASFLIEAITVKAAEGVMAWLNQQAEDQRSGLFDRYIQDQLTYPSDHPYTPAPRASFNKIIADLVSNYGNVNLDDASWITSQRDVIEMDILLSAQRLISDLIERMRTDTQAPMVLVDEIITD